jgi:hypothetical protein
MGCNRHGAATLRSVSPSSAEREAECGGRVKPAGNLAGGKTDGTQGGSLLATREMPEIAQRDGRCGPTRPASAHGRASAIGTSRLPLRLVTDCAAAARGMRCRRMGVVLDTVRDRGVTPSIAFRSLPTSGAAAALGRVRQTSGLERRHPRSRMRGRAFGECLESVDAERPARWSGPGMTWIVEDTPERMVVRLGALFPHSAICVLDKGSGRARFYRRLFFMPRRTIDVSLRQIADVEVVEVGHPLNSFDPRVVLASGKRFYLSPADTREATREVVGRVREFLGLS